MDTIERALRDLGTATQRRGIERRAEDGTINVNQSAKPPISRLEQETKPSPQSPASGGTRRLATLDNRLIALTGLQILKGGRSRFKEEFRHIKRPLLVNAEGKGAAVGEHKNLIMVTSARPHEGKTFTALNLALSVASERDRTVLLIDADVVNPSVHLYFGLEEGRAGLVDFLVRDELRFTDVLVETNVPKLSVLLAGSQHHLSTELLASESMRRLTNEMSKRYSDRVIIFDAPPLLVTTEASVLASLVGQIVLVVEAEKTPQTDVKDALRLLKNDHGVGIVFNKVKQKSSSMYYELVNSDDQAP